MQTIPTVFGNTLHRSRTEARWAAFFSEAGIQYIYEPEGFEIDLEGKIIRYLPDFLLPHWDLWLEVRILEPAPDLLAVHHAFATHKHSAIVHGLPRLHSRYGAGYVVLHYSKGQSTPERYLFACCRRCGEPAICPESWFHGSTEGVPLASNCDCICVREATFWARRLIMAYQYSMSHRFGEWFGYKLV